MNHVVIDWETFQNKYKPIKNHLLESAPCNDWMYETYGTKNKTIS